MTAITIAIGSSTKCNSCGAAIIWANTPKGKVAPYQVDPDGHWVIDGGKARHVGEARQLELGLAQPTYYSSHFSTCPQADQWRAPR